MIIPELDFTKDFYNYCKNKVSNFTLTENSDDIEGVAMHRKLKFYPCPENDNAYLTDINYKEHVLSDIFYELMIQFEERSRQSNEDDYLYSDYLIYIEKLYRSYTEYDENCFTPRLSTLIKYKYKKLN